MPNIKLNDGTGRSVNIEVGDDANKLLPYIGKKRRDHLVSKLGNSFAIVPIGGHAIIQFGLDRKVANIHIFTSQKEAIEFRSQLEFKELDMEVSMHVLERLRDRFEYTKNYSIKGLMGTTVRAVRSSRMGFMTTIGRGFRFYGNHVFVVDENRIVTLIKARPEFHIYAEAYAHSGTRIPDVLVSKYISEKADDIYLRYGK